jgi:structural maintenance of chromosome 3 (chondroitin sulfate proteoglycan 6)
MDGRKNLLEIELNESLRRRQRELQAKLEAIGEEAESGDGTSAESVDARKRELRSLGASIAAATKRSQGRHALVRASAQHYSTDYRRRGQGC